jgi:CHAT domain-containing protein
VNTFLMEEKTLVLVPVPQLLPEILAAVPAPKPGGNARPPSLLVLGDVDYGADPGAASPAPGVSREAIVTAPGMEKRVAWSRLAATGLELEAVQQSFKQRFEEGTVVMLRDKAATESAFREQAPRHRFLHLATHGFFAGPALRSALMPSEKILDQEQFGRDGFFGHNPGLLSGLVLAGANAPAKPDQDDGILTAMEVADLDLRGVNLVVLSACETGLGATAGGEGVLGLQRAFQSAGARSVVASLWKVEDQGTAALMGLFYHKLWRENKTPVDALREAQLTVYLNPERIPRLAKERGPDFEAVAKLPATPGKESKAGTRAPVKLWAAFVLSGAWQ